MRFGGEETGRRIGIWLKRRYFSLAKIRVFISEKGHVENQVSFIRHNETICKDVDYDGFIILKT